MALDKPDLDQLEASGGSKIEKIPLVGTAVEAIRGFVKDKVLSVLKTAGTALILGA